MFAIAIMALSLVGLQSVNADDYEQTAKLIASDGAAFDSLGKELELSGNTMIVGAAGHDHTGIGLNSGGAYIFSADTAGLWSERAELRPTPEVEAGDLFGFSVDISGDTAIVGATNTTSQPGGAS